ncbi:prepilin peptidase [Bordetella pseudohinzii]|uniref:Pectic enzymes secretion protein outO n=1 Tax=Bordetella pseudohinzii TaxID=1331258 RepID=A0A0J6C434_9BORD|nr:A24 family peptidase [Bordetella pseudohinzii]ANY14817.1 type 4 prepilin-like protein leader peptide processing enzyme [Bordetella pseudohinzii]KMM25838.1 type 4 prepilin-like protein leader peptide processing enzyme [Bordetella pseudohinzii]KXA77666.1 type 4 prepilin-like protein leader peptide processing enzyme [Bordetella pseudohinzii]KXA79318.1 type 4 prepilin-like protein leader peptide processing enzyme [Bordetella pseudohinzii]CUJ16363.1 Pectic enzymes secretion protein outO [Bordete
MSLSVVYLLAALAGLALGGWVTVLSHYLPAHLRRAWRGRPARAALPPQARQRAWPWIGWYLASRGGAGRRGPAWRAPWPELLLAALFMACVWRFGASWLAVCAMVYCLALVLMAWVDRRSCILPDILTLPFLWAGLLVNLDGALTPLPQAVLGAVFGYGVLWVFYHGFKRCTGLEGMGYGDFKLTAALGAWLGVGVLAPLLLLAALAGVVAGLAARLRGGPDRPRPFAPFLAMAGVAALLWPPNWGGLF